MLIRSLNTTMLLCVLGLFSGGLHAAALKTPMPVDDSAATPNASANTAPARRPDRLSPYAMMYYFKLAVLDNRVDDALSCLILDKEIAELKVKGFTDTAIATVKEMRMRNFHAWIKDSTFQIYKRPDGSLYTLFDKVYVDGKEKKSLRKYVTRDGKTLIVAKGKDGNWRFTEQTVNSAGPALMPVSEAIRNRTNAVEIKTDTPKDTFQSLINLGALCRYEKIADNLIEKCRRDKIPDILDSEKDLSLERIRVKRATKLYHWLRTDTLPAPSGLSGLDTLQADSHGRIVLTTASGKKIPFVKQIVTGTDANDNAVQRVTWRFAIDVTSTPAKRDWLAARAATARKEMMLFRRQPVAEEEQSRPDTPPSGTLPGTAPVTMPDGSPRP